MKKLIKLLCLLFIITFLQPFSFFKAFAENENNITILFTHDMHDHILPVNVKQNDKILQLGGYARLKNAIDNEKLKDSDALLLDAGDFSMGTVFQVIYSSDSPQLRLMGELGYDAITLGNHEFDFRAAGLAQSLTSAIKNSNKLPVIVQSNIEFPQDKNGNLTESLKSLKEAMEYYGVKDYTIIERKGIKIGIFGLIGKDSASNAPMAEVKFLDAVENAKRVTEILKNKEKVDLIICLSHSGTNFNKSKSEDEILAKKVPDIDIIISGHSHTKLSKPIISGKTIIVSCGEYCENLGVLKINRAKNGLWNVKDYNLIPIDNSLKDDSNISLSIEGFKKIVEEKYLSKFNLSFDEIIAYSPFDFVESSNIGKKHGEEPLGNLITDSYIYAVKKAEGNNYEPVTAAIVPNGTIRASFVKGNITAADAFAVSSLGIGPDKISGYPLISVYLTGKELKTACEVDASIAPIMPEAQLYISGISYSFNPKRIIFNKVTRAEIIKDDGTLEKIDDNKLYRVVAGLYSAQMLSVIGEKSHGLLSVVPKTKDGKPITDFEAQIIYGNENGKKYELKEWLALAQYLKSFEKINGIPQIPEYYNKTHGRKVIENSYNIVSILKNPNSISLTIYAVIIVLLFLIIFVIYKISSKRKTKKHIEI